MAKGGGADIPIVPKISTYIWYNLILDNTYKEYLPQRIIEHFHDLKGPEGHKKKGGPKGRTPRAVAGASKAQSVDDVVVMNWRCHRSHQFFGKLRMAAERLRGGHGVGFKHELELEHKSVWRERALMREGWAKETRSIQFALMQRLVVPILKVVFKNSGWGPRIHGETELLHSSGHESEIVPSFFSRILLEHT
eukprot:gene24163-1535_t